MLISIPLIKWGINLTSHLISIILDTLTFLTPLKEECFIRGEICRQQWNCKEPSNVTRFLYLNCLGKWTKFPFQITCLTLFLLSLHKFCFFVSVTLISFILKCYPLFCINFFYVKVVFHQIHVNLSRVNLQLFFSIRIYIGWNLQNFKNILRINPKLRYWKGYIFVCSKAVNTIQLYVFNLFHSLKGNWLGNKTKKPALIITV